MRESITCDSTYCLLDTSLQSLKPNKTEKLTDLKATIKHGNSVAFVQLEKKAFINLKVGGMDEVESL